MAAASQILSTGLQILRKNLPEQKVDNETKKEGNHHPAHCAPNTGQDTQRELLGMLCATPSCIRKEQKDQEHEANSCESGDLLTHRNEVLRCNQNNKYYTNKKTEHCT